MNPDETKELFTFIGKVEARLDSGDHQFQELKQDLSGIKTEIGNHGKKLAVLMDRGKESRKTAMKSGAGAGGILMLVFEVVKMWWPGK